MEKRFEIMISTCQKYSDLWDANVLLLNRNWPDRNAPAYLVTDAPTSRSFDGVEVICAGSGQPITRRLALALEKVRAEYVILTLDDYFFTETIRQEKIEAALDFMDTYQADYIQLYPQPEGFLKRDGAVQTEDYPGIYIVDISRGNYKVALTPGIWRKDFLRATLKRDMDPWQYEVSLTDTARKLGALCATSNRGELPYLDVVRKGKLLRKAAGYFRKDPIYQSDRPVMGWIEEWMLNVRIALKFWLPGGALRLLKRLMLKLGFTFYSPVA